MKVTLAIVLLFLCSVSSNNFFTKVEFDALSKLDKQCEKFQTSAYQARFFTVKEFSLISFLNT